MSKQNEIYNLINITLLNNNNSNNKISSLPEILISNNNTYSLTILLLNNYKEARETFFNSFKSFILTIPQNC